MPGPCLLGPARRNLELTRAEEVRRYAGDLRRYQGDEAELALDLLEHGSGTAPRQRPRH